ncbi:hypothetical protein PVAND_000595 [Polypedilum vanderplanki]|uniref:Major facilitator superfamily (MFS) profile domain-containing protein n=1 Tax=Polypedilum vanderplanki TaxID=319348 RepID=A0A9J6BL23_POLVA|nr:hypothetical protein PVAND_000595 [Polypedilum vanderplanki]
MNHKKLISLSQREIIGFDDEYININITKLKKYFYCLLASLGYMLAGFFVGWSSKLLILHERSTEFNNLSRCQISWVVSAFPLGIVIISMGLSKIYYYIGPKLLLMLASMIIMISWILNMFFDGNNFNILFSSRLIGGCGSGIIFVIMPIYMKEIGGSQYKTLIVDLLTTQFGLGICIQYLMGES